MSNINSFIKNNHITRQKMAYSKNFKGSIINYRFLSRAFRERNNS